MSGIRDANQSEGGRGIARGSENAEAMWNLEQNCIGDKIEARERRALLVEITRESFLAQLELLEKVRQQILEHIIAVAILHDVARLECLRRVSERWDQKALILLWRVEWVCRGYLLHDFFPILVDTWARGQIENLSL